MTFWNEKRLLWLIILSYIVFFGIFTSVRHYNFQTQTWDLAVFVQTFWNSVHGKIMFNNLEEVHGPFNHLAVHMRPLMFLLVPGYALFPSPYFLLLIQTIALALGAWPLYLLAEKILKNKKCGLAFASAYLLYPSLHWVNAFDFHEIAFLPPLLLAAVYFFESENWLWSGVFFALAAGAKEDAILIVAFTAFYFLIRRKKDNGKEFSLAIVLLSVAYFLISIKLIMPMLGGGLLRLDRYSNLGNNVPEIISNSIHRPLLLVQTAFNWQKIQYLFWLLLPVVFLPLFSGWSFLLLIPGLLENLLTGFQYQFSGLYQYDAVLIAGIFIAAIYGLENIVNRWPQKIKLAKNLLIGAALIGYCFRSPANPFFFPVELFKTNPVWTAYRKMIQTIPENPKLSVAAQTNLVPHLSNREYAFMLGKEPFLTDLVLLDAQDSFGFATNQAFQDYINKYVHSGYQITNLDNRYFIFSKKGIALRILN